MRRSLFGAATICGSFFTNQLANRLGFEYGIAAAIFVAVVGYGLLITSEPLKKLWGWAGCGSRNRIMWVVVLGGVITGLLGAAVSAVLIALNIPKTAHPSPAVASPGVQALPPITASR